MTIQDYILEYKVNDEIVCNIFDYYDRYIKPLDKRFQRYSLGVSKLVLCWFKDHEDVNPSMGCINDRLHKGGKIYHCFGCGRTGNVIRLHQIIQAQYHSRTLTEEEASYELAGLFEIPLDDFDEYSEDDYERKYMDKLNRIDELTRKYTIADYSATIRHIRIDYKGQPLDSAGLNKVNSECVKLIATEKLLNN